MKISTQTPGYQVELEGDQVRVEHQGQKAEIARPSDDVMVYSALGFPDPVVVRRHELVIGSERIPLSEIGASAADKLALEGFAAMLEGAAKQLRIASSNQEKLNEFRAALTPLGIAVVAPDKLPLDVIEDGKTYEDNALKKVRAWVAMTGQACVADDSGIAIDALGGAPGVHSARYSGVSGAGRHLANNTKILKNLGDTPDELRTATTSTVLAYQKPGEQPILFRADVHGRVLREPKGELGWATDVLFIPDGATKTLAEMQPEERVQYTSRHQALQKLLAYLERQGKE
ncbi:MAG: non-canonical purine NTP pyrophosphatase [Myxococcota bacterium]